MKTISIGKRNAAYQQLLGLRDNRTKRLRQGAFFAEGVRNINQAVAAGWKIRSFEVNYRLSGVLEIKMFSLGNHTYVEICAGRDLRYAGV